jgi:hypothetical protein
MSLSRELAKLSDEELPAALRMIATNALSGGCGSTKQFDNWMNPVSHAFHAAGWSKERLKEFKHTWRREFSKAKLAHAQARQTNAPLERPNSNTAMAAA